MSDLLEVNGVVKSFGGLEVLRGLTFTLPEAQITCLIGPNGAGKTTAFNVVSGFVRPDRGSVRLRGQDISRLRPEQRANLGMARSFQVLRLFERMTVLENVEAAVRRTGGSGHRESARDQARHALALVGLEARASSWVKSLSYAEQKLVAMGQLIASDASLMLLDEPTSGLDGQSLEDAIELVRTLKDLGKTVLVVEHNVSLVRQLADRVLFMDQGVVAVAGPPDDVIENPLLTELYFGTAGNTDA